MEPEIVTISSMDAKALHMNASHLEDIKMDSNFAWMLCSLVSTMAWVIYITYYNSRVIGYFITRLLNRLFIREGYMHVGSLTCNVLSGKIMFRDVIYICHDYTVRVQDGWLIFRWWRAYVPKDVSEDLSHSDTRLSVMLNGFELHVYNRCEMYGNLEKAFGLEPQMFPREDDSSGSGSGGAESKKGENENGATNSNSRRRPQTAALSQGHSWRDLIPVIKVDVASGRVVFGNRLVPTTLSINVEEAHFVYSTKPAASRLDHFMHFTKCKAENFKVILAPSPKYTGMVDDPPRYMGEGFVILSSNNIELYYYMDEAGVVPEEPEMLQLANGDIVESAPPIWGMDIKCGKGTDFSYGPWADRQRDHLFKFFFPNDCQPLKITKAPQPGEKRSATSFDIRLSTLNEATVDILFSKNKETNAVHVNVGPGSYLEVTMPWVVGQDGYTTKITGQLLHLEATTSLQYRSLVESETLEFTVKCHYPIKWNDHQEWILNLTGCKATVNLIYAHKWFFQDLVNDWASKSRPDLLHFVPYTWMITLLMKEFELITLCNEYNWIDCSSQNQENAHMAFCGDLFDLSFDLPFCDFLPSTIPLRFWIQGESVDLALYLPEICTSRSILLALDANAKLLGRDGNLRQRNDGTRKWRNVCQRSNGWVDCWSVPIVALCINYIYHPMPPLGPPPQADITTPEKEEILLSPMRIPRCRKSPGIHWSQDGSQKFDPTTLPPDKVTLELEIGPSVLLVYGAWIRNFMHLKENIFGEDQAFTDMHQSRAASSTSVDPTAAAAAPASGGDRAVDVSTSTGAADDADLLKPKEFDPRQYRPFEVTVSITMHDIQAHLVKNCNEGDPPCPVILLERFGFEMKKGYKETQLQLLLSPAILLTSDKVPRPTKESHLTQGHLMLSGFQVRGHAMFSDEGRTLDEETLEYAWLVEIQLGKLSGKLTAPQLHHLVTSLETFVLLAKDAENNLRPPRLPKACHHGLPPLQCSESDPDTRYRCPSGDDIKYRMTRVAVDAVDLYLLENGTAFQIWASPIRIATCNLHGHLVKSGVTGVLPAVQVRQFVATGSNFSGGNANHSNTNTTGSGRSQHNASRMEGSLMGELWLEVGSVSLGPLVVEAAMSLPTPEHNLHLVQHRYLRTHDEAHKRLWFLWSGEGSSTKTVGRCGCIGGCAFFGGNRNGAKFFKPSRQDFQEGVNMAAFRIHEPGRDPGFGQSILHEGQLVFHTPPYGSQDVSLQEPVNGWDTVVGNPRSTGTTGLKVTTTNERNSGESPGTLAGERSRSVAETNKDSSSRLSTASPSPVSCYGDKRALGRRFSYTSASNRSGNNATTRDVPYARLVDNSPTNLLPPKLDSDSMLNAERSKSILSVPETEGAPKSSISDSKLAVDYFNTPPTKESYQQGTSNVVLVTKPTLSSEVNPSESHHSLSMDNAEENLRKEVQRTVSMSSENHSEAFYSADEDISQQVGMSASRTSSLRHSITLTRQDSSGSNTANRQVNLGRYTTTAGDIFYSVREDSDPHFSITASCASSLNNCNGLVVDDMNGCILNPATRKKFSSELSIMPGAVHTLPTTTVTTSAATGSEGRSRLSSHRSDHEIHTPEHRNQQLARSPDMSVSAGEDDKKGGGVLNMATPHRRYGNLATSSQQRAASPRYMPYSNGDSLTGLQDVSEGQTGENQDGVLLDSSDTHSVSSTSFISAVSSQEDMALVNLHMQVNKPIIDSPLLMSSYVNHLSQASCNNWTQSSLPSGCDAFTVPLFQRTEEGRLIYIGGRYSPKFETLTEGFTSLKMITRLSGDHHGTPPPPSKTPTHPYAWDESAFLGSESDDLETGCEEELLALQNEYGTRTTLILKMKGDVDIMLSPLVLESLQRFIDAVTPTLATLHPLTVLNHLHAECISQVEAANILKRDQSLSYLSQFQASSKRSTAERNVSSPTGQGMLQANVYEESVSTQTQGTIMLPKVNITLLQASVVEEMISFSALDNIRDLTCVSLFAVCFDAVTAKFHCSKQAREVVQTFHHPAVQPSGHKKSSGSGKTGKPFLLGHQTNPGNTDMPGGEPVYIETSEKQQEEMVFTLNISKIHGQLRRLRNECSILKDAVITAIPSHYSRVFFTCARVTSPMRGVDFYVQQQQHQQQQQETQPRAPDSGVRHSVDDSSNSVEEKLGFIMFECGLEGVSLKVVKRSQFEKGENGIEEKAEHAETDASHTDTVRSRDELEQQATTTSGASQGDSVTSTSATTKATKAASEGTGAGPGPTEGSAEPGSGVGGTTNASTPAPGAGTIVNQTTDDAHGNTSSCVIELRTVWFNFAAPPRAPITRKIDFTRLDWNLLSTASPAINAWMNPSNRFAIRVVHMVRSMYRRSTGIVACLMAEALDVQGIHIPMKSRYGRYTPLAKTLQEDPSCQLCAVLQKYVLQTDLTAIETNLRETDLPMLSTLRQGVIVLSRQWKNVLYTPLLLDHKYKSKHVKPLNVTFAVPEPDEENVLTDGEGEGSGEECEVTDECAMLLNTEAGGMHKVIKAHDKSGTGMKPDELLVPPVGSPHIASRVDHTPMVTPGIVVGGVDSLFNSPSPPSVQQQGHGGLTVGGHRKRKKSLPPSHPPSSSRASIVFPILSGNPFTTAASQKKFDAEQGIGYGPLKEERSSMPHSHGQHHHLGSNPSIYSGGGPGSQHSMTSLENNFSPTGNSSVPASKYWDASRKETGEDLYSWMAKQQDFMKDADVSKTQLKGNWESKINTLTTEDTLEDPEYLQMTAGGYSLYPMHDSLRLLDAHLIFEPLLSCLGVMPQQMISNLSGSAAPGSGNVSSFDTWGSNLSLVGAIETMRIDIVVSEFGKTSDKKKTKSSSSSTATGGNKGSKNIVGGKFYLDIPPETPAFLCEKMGVELDLKKMADMTVDDMIQKQNVLYISRGQLKKHTSTILNISLNVRYISQQVNMPLLRLLHQISNMYQNVKETQMELKEQQPEVKRETSTKNNKNGSSSTSDLHENASVIEDKMKLPAGNGSVAVPGFPHSLSQQKILSPSASLRSRPQSFAQKLRSTSKSVKGYMNLSEGVTTPMFAVSPSGSGLEHITIASDKSKDVLNTTPRCWKTVYYLLDLYATMPETKTITHRFSVAADISEGYKGNRKYDLLAEVKSNEDVEKGTTVVPEITTGSTPLPHDKPRELSLVTGERTRLIVFGVARIHRTRLLATLSGLKLEAEITSLHSSLTCRKKSRPASLECSLTGHIGRTMIVLLEGVAPNQQTVVKVTVGKSQALYSSISRRSKDKNSGLLTVGAVNIDIPQHPVALHGMMTRGSKQLSSTLQELRVTRTSSRISRGTTAEEGDFITQHSPRHFHSTQAPQPGLHRQQQESSLLQPLVMQFSIILQSLSITAALLPSLQAQYKMDQVNSTGVTGSKAKFTIDLPQHSLSFTTKLQVHNVTEAHLPSEASIELPKVHVSAEYIQDGNNPREAQFADGVVLRQGSYLSAVADIGVFEHSLTTDLLNHLVFVQKVFMKEVNEVVQKVYGGEKPVPLWLEDSEEPTSSSLKRILFSLVIRIKRIQLTATTPTNSAVRLETGAVEFQLSNRVQNVSGAAQPNPYMKIFGKAQVDVNLSLGQLLKNVMFEEAEPEFQQYAFFKTRIGLRNAFQDEMVQGEDKEVVLITLKRPLIYIQPMAVDKAILVWLNYKNAYEYWNEQRSNLNKEVLTATQQVFEKVPFGQLSAPHLGTLFLQLTVDDMGICLPLNPLPLASWGVNRQMYDVESRGAVVVTLESTSISACSSGSLVSKGRFMGLCLRFADDFETSLDDWKPDMSDSTIMNLCVVSEGTYEVCSRTIAQKQGTENAKWFLNVQWQMEGVDIHLDVNVGKQLSALGHTLTMLTGSQEEDEPITVDYDSDEVDQVDGNTASLESISLRRSRNLTDSLPAFVFDPSLDAKKRSKLIEKEMNEQAKIINDLRSLGASHGTIEQEMKRLQELEAMVFKDFRRDMIQKLRRQSVKASSIKGKFGLGSKASTYRSRSFIVPSPTPEHHLEMESPDDVGGASINSNGNSASFESSPRSGPSRSASLRVRGLSGPRVTFSDTHNICRQSSLPSAGSDLSLPEGDLEWTGGDHIDISGDKVELRRKSPYSPSNYDHVESSVPLLDPCQKEPGGGTSPASYTAAFQKPQEPNIDFELDVKVFINSGKCVLHTKDPAKEDELKLTSRMKKERSCSGGMFDFPPSSPNMSRRNKEKPHGASSTTRLRYLHSTVAQLVDLTIFHIPGLDVKVHYESRTLHEENVSPRMPNELSAQQALSQTRKSGTKKASLFAWMTLQSIPEETIISPHILEFLEQTLEPIPSTLQQAKTSGAVNAMFAMEQETSWAAATATSNYVYASFPVDVIVYFHMQPSTFRFSCLPVSRVECMLQLPSLDIVFSSKRAEEELHSEFGEGRPSSRPASGMESSTSRFDMGPSPSAVGGLSVTGCLADFSVYIFHPYGGGKKTGLKEAQWSPLADSERKDSLSVNVEFVKFHLSRSRKLNFQCDQQQTKGLKSSDQGQAVIRFSTIIDIGSASFKYDMRRLTEILAFPKAWYRRSIVRRLFLGDLSISATYSEGEESSPSSLEDEHLLAAPQSLGRSNMLDSSGRNIGDGHGLSRSAPTTERSPMLPTRERLRLSLENDISRHARFRDSSGGRQSSKPDTPSPSEQKSGSAWETLVLFAVNFTRLNVHMNMGNVMGNVTWLTKDFRSEGRLSIGSTGHKNMYIGVGLGGSSLDAKGGIVGGTIELSKIDTYIHIREDPGTEPDHTVGLKLFALELRLDYMGTGVLMSRVSSLAVSLRDEWKINRSKKSSENFIPTRRPAMIFMHGDLGWDQLQLMISKSTTADLLKMFYKLEEFFSQQFKSSKRVFSSLQPRTHPKNSSFKKKQPHAKKKSTGDASSSHTWASSALQDARHHRHWQRVLGQVGGLHLSTLSFPLPMSGTVLGGTMELHGNNISLACFHGINFKSKSWALFSLKEPCISFATEAQEIPSAEMTDQLDVHVVQTLTFSLGMMAEHPHAQHHSMATVCRLSRNVLFPPQFRTLQEWFHYAFSNSEIDAVDRFPSLERERLESSSEQQRSRSSSSSKLQDPNHTREVIFALPSLQLHLKTEHLQAAKTPDVAGQKPLVECSFITEFEDHIFVTVDAEAFFFLHDLITSYVKEKERVTGSVSGGARAVSPDPDSRRGRDASGSASGGMGASGATSDEERKRKAFDPAEMFTKDWRNYHCKTWHLEPTVRLLSWAGKSIEPYGVDYILQKLGFSHARTTIPKWMQRGFMDPLDKVLAVLMLRMITVVREEPPASEGDSDRKRTDGK
ncbi:bridge-like lipid transfer protein family member 1 isoform X3 [Periplaneta americana]|uniref:bridge-like lipid transfer protein family member 1 isoform X3 n=1 Tax=Periplaneta americana TaxID=6978 RepID=UPI0037E93A0A